MNKVHQMSDLEYNAFIEHCKSSEIYREKVVVTKARKMIEPTGEMAIEEHDDFLSNLYEEDYDELFEKGIWIKNGKMYSIIETKTIKIKGYNGRS